MTLEELFEYLREHPREMTQLEMKLQRIDFAYGNLACSTNHRPKRDVFERHAIDSGLTKEEFDAWADGREWW